MANESFNQTCKLTLPVHGLWHLLQAGWFLHLKGQDPPKGPSQQDAVAPEVTPSQRDVLGVTVM